MSTGKRELFSIMLLILDIVVSVFIGVLFRGNFFGTWLHIAAVIFGLSGYLYIRSIFDKMLKAQKKKKDEILQQNGPQITAVKEEVSEKEDRSITIRSDTEEREGSTQNTAKEETAHPVPVREKVPVVQSQGNMQRKRLDILRRGKTKKSQLKPENEELTDIVLF